MPFTKLNKLPSSIKIELLALFLFSMVIFLIAAKYDALEALVEFSEQYEEWELDELFTLLMVSAVSVGIFAYRRWREQSAEIVKRKLVEEELVYLINHDNLTAIPNRTFFNSQVSKSLQSDRAFSVMLLDLNKFKKVNDVYGHQVGDLALVEVSNRLQTIIHNDDICARLGGDEFALLLFDIATKEEASSKAKEIIDILDQPIQVDNYEFELGGSIGIVLNANSNETVIDILRKADISMYAAKRSIVSRWIFFDEEMDNVLFERQFVETELKKAVKAKQLTIDLQPIYDLHNDKIVCFEALARWNHHQLGEVEPTHFIAVAEEIGLIFELGEYVLNQACAAAMTWSEPIPISVNVSAHQIRHPDFIFRIKRALSISGLAPERLEIELTESILLEDIPRAKNVIKELKKIGVSVSLDDFGTGYSSLAYLHSFDFNKLKIDREFILGIEKNRKNRAIVSALSRMCKEMNINLIAEGIETQQNLAYLKEFECQFGQGFFLGRPSDTLSTQSLVKSNKKKN